MPKNSDESYNLEERTAKLGENIIELCKRVKKDSITNPLITQVIRSGTSVGANYVEANQSGSKKEFRHKVYIAKKEASETMHWLRMITKSSPDKRDSCVKLWQEAKELTLIFSKITSTLNKKK